MDVVSEKPYRFVPPYHSMIWVRFFWPYVRRYLNRHWGLAQIECRGTDLLRQSLAAGHGVLLAPNHSRYCDPLALGVLSLETRTPLFLMASWHLFMKGGAAAWILRRIGAFSVFREGLDRAAVGAAIDILTTAERPLVIFPEGAVTRTNDRLGALLEGTTFIARTAAKKRAKLSPPGKVLLHPVAIKYYFLGDVRQAVSPVLDMIETRLAWRARPEMPLWDRIVRVGLGLLSLKEIELLGRPQTGDLKERLERLIDHLLAPLEQEWLGGAREPHVVARVKRIRSAILPDMMQGDLSETEKARRWGQLADCYLAQQFSWYPPDYISPNAPPERILETVERFEEDLTDAARIHRPMKTVIQVGEGIEVSPERDRAAPGDPLLQELDRRLRGMLAALQAEPVVRESPAPQAAAAGQSS